MWCLPFISCSQVPKKIRPRRHRNNGQIFSEEVPGISNSEVETCDRDDASKKQKQKVLKQRHRRHKDNEPTGECEAVAPVLKNIRPRRHGNNGHIFSEGVHRISNSEVETCDGDVALKKKKVIKQCHRRRKGTEPAGEYKAVVPVTNEEDGHKEPTEMSCSDQIIGTSDGDDTIAFFLHKLKKRKLEVADFAVQDCPSSCIQNPEVSSQYEPTVPLDDKPGRQKLARGQKLALQEPMRGVLGINRGSNHEIDDPVITSLVKKKSKKRDAQTTKQNSVSNEPDAGDVPKQEVTIKPVKEQVSIGADGDDETDDITLADWQRQYGRGDIHLR